ncbi:IS21-like element helper ATPase IstB [Ureibacillus thermosphaericus]|jgi:DNA replication protein DnaC|uniref:DNA replication protein DnaC n=1 Tax=Ureibacillus thermosphaericus TaxID=51173 RepID=A0A840PR53_URETH|nr:IS21-like element helper ATPase IstB [Ureibacillus thermosphaericus]MBB5148483.1 DNA replication protein DnaC [Ureibacillus thermosphaericus]NKZ30977.1 ATP-binding protein [Ureibacillus thermosphaericus]
MDKQKEMIDMCKELRLPSIRSLLEQEVLLEQYTSPAEFLYFALKQEMEDRYVRAKANRIRLANFPEKKLLEELDVEALPQNAAVRLPHLKELKFIQDKQNVLLIGSPGTGKTHLAIGLGIEACLAGYKVYFTSVASLVNQLKESRSARTLRSFELKFEKYDLVIIDELGYISFDKEGAELLFTHLSLRAGRAATIITSNLTFERWEEVFHDPVLTSALTDRLTHRAHIINMIGGSYRILETKEWMEQSNF